MSSRRAAGSCWAAAWLPEGLRQLCLASCASWAALSAGTISEHPRGRRAQVAADIKETTCRTSDVPFHLQDNLNIPTVTYEVTGLQAAACVKHEQQLAHAASEGQAASTGI